MAVPFYGQATFIGAKSGTVYNKAFYASDAAGMLNLDDGSGAPSATTSNFMTFQEPVYLAKLSSGAAATVKYARLIVDGAPTGWLFSFAEMLNTLARGGLDTRVGISAGKRIQLLQV